MNYLTKYLELLDTVFLVLKKKPLTFLHIYHHSATIALCYTQIWGRTSISWVPICVNLGIHVVSYFYYLKATMGSSLSWKRFIIGLEVAQFILDLGPSNLQLDLLNTNKLSGFIIFAIYNHYIHIYLPWLPNVGDCSGHPTAGVAGLCILTSFLILFTSLYFASEKKPSQEGQKANSFCITKPSSIKEKD